MRRSIFDARLPSLVSLPLTLNGPTANIMIANPPKMLVKICENDPTQPQCHGHFQHYSFTMLILPYVYAICRHEMGEKMFRREAWALGRLAPFPPIQLSDGGP